MTHFSFKMAAALVSSLLVIGLAQAELRAEKQESEQEEVQDEKESAVSTSEIPNENILSAAPKADSQ
ncbi:MAG: hypothetical protein OM95_04000 [Bdellovibrio sp. ArHS]|uniref:hypothetical protein n=1 Tax=Bdellovibrio sp. ArHS TaxID=1569284 RepID=UPI000583D18F|nr:hypothetical protein [Bdellovibrio sp. ArHS]KHD89302.1 MAG: hypothetical protein OM95_04000 [Bdellovibrio sp. ArHS]